MVTFVGKFVNPVQSFFVAPIEDKYEIWVHDEDGASHKHSSAPEFEDADEAYEYLESLRERYEDQYDQYLEDHSDDIRRSEEYEMYRNEY